MKNRRILSLLLTAALLASSLPLTASANDAAASADVTAGTDLREGDDGSYVRIYNRTNSAWLGYIDNSKTLTAGKTYEVGFWARTDSYINAPEVNAHARVRTVVGSDGWNNIIPEFKSIQLTSDWTFYSAQFTAPYTEATQFIFRASGAANSVGAIDIDGLYVKEVVDGEVTDTNYATNGGGLFDGTAGWYFKIQTAAKLLLSSKVVKRFISQLSLELAL